MMIFIASFIERNVCQANMVDATSENEAMEIFYSYHPEADLAGIRIATADDTRPGMPILKTKKERSNT
jgi:hypothetical protein